MKRSLALGIRPLLTLGHFGHAHERLSLTVVTDRLLSQ